MAKAAVTAVNDPRAYAHGYNGTALKVILIQGELEPGQKIQANNIVARGSNFNWSMATPTTQADEINTTFVQETNYGRTEVGTGRIQVVFNLAANDAMPTWESIRSLSELTILEVTGDDHPMTVNGVPTILNAFLGVRIINQGSTTQVNQQKVLDVEVNFRQRLTGMDWKKLAGGSVNYPATVS